MDHQIKITQEDFVQFNKVLKLIYNDLNHLLIKHNVVNIVIKEDGNIYFNHNKTNIMLTDQDRVLRTIFNFYFFCMKNSFLFRESFIDRGMENESWYKEYQKLINTIKSINAPEPKKKWY